MRPSLVLRKCPPLSAEDVIKLNAKAELEELIAAAGYKSGRALAKRLSVKEPTLRGWRNPKDLTRNPPSWVKDLLTKEAQIRRDQIAVGALKVAVGT